ncbi:MAG: hypothetical protein PHV13_06035 [Candidatus ainarchaeum sp.]|nr:hypothetical protein [Candidatus ainarchaeum sp.]
MAGKYATTDFMVPEVEAMGAVPIESTIGTLRNDIAARCTVLQQRAKAISSAGHGHGAFRLRFWENRITQIREAHAATFSIQELKHLKRQCQTLSLEMEEFAKGLL